MHKLITEKQITVFDDTGTPYFFMKGDSSDVENDGENIAWKAIVTALEENNYDLAISYIQSPELAINVATTDMNADRYELLKEFTDNSEFFNLNIDNTLEYCIDDTWYLAPVSLDARIAKALECVEEGGMQAVSNFFDKLFQNPSATSVEELLGFMVSNNLPITKEGDLIAYKVVQDDYKDYYTGEIDNSVGATPKMARNQVNDNRDETCSTGFHFCSIAYLKSSGYGSVYSNPLMILKVNPEHVVSIPSDYDNSKGRCCTYTVIGEVTGESKTKLLGLETEQNNLWDSNVVEEEFVENFNDVDEIVEKEEVIVSDEDVEKLMDDLVTSATDNDVEEVFLTVNGESVMPNLVSKILIQISTNKLETLSDIRNFILNEDIYDTIPDRMPSRIIEKLKLQGVLEGTSGEWTRGDKDPKYYTQAID